ncbi:hypothetical protein [Salirhabdus sp. Marseille-P4669]|nr:hypothetical protein [Salirhabdus sp. Marseille-P4669]
MKKLMFILVLAVTVAFSVSDVAPAQQDEAAPAILFGDKDPGPVHG